MTPSTDILDALLQLPSVYGAQLSPDGRWVAWIWSGTGPTTDVYVAPTDGSAAPVRLSKASEDVALVSWAPDSGSVVVEHDHEGDERMQLFRIVISQPGVMEPLTPAAPDYFIRGGDLHPNGRWLIYAANVDAETGVEIEQSCIYRHDLQTGERLLLARPEKGGYIVPQLNDQGTHILYNRLDRDPAGTQLWLVDIDGLHDMEVLNVGDAAKVAADWMPDGQRAVVVADAGDYRRLGVWNRESGEVRWLIDDPARAIESASALRGSDAPLVVVVEVQGARSRASLLDIATGEETPLPELPGELLPLQQVGDAWIGVYSSATQPTDVVRFELDHLRPDAFESLTRLWERTSLQQNDLQPAEDIRWRSVDGLEIQGWLYRPRGEPRGTIVHVHGGPTWHYSDAFAADVQFYVSQGFNVLQPNYRGSTGFGLAYQEAIKVDGWGGREQDDIRTGIEALIERGIATAGRVGVTGTSYGGYSSWCQITRNPPQIVTAAAPICGMTDLVVDYETTRPDLRPYSEEMLGGTPATAPERYRERSPIHFVQHIKGHLLIVQGMRDPNVTPENVRVVAGELQNAGVEYQLLTFDDEGHGISRQANRRTLYDQLARFFAQAFDGE